MTFTVEFFDTNGSAWLPPAGLFFEPERWSALAWGGPEKARIRATGPAFGLWELLRVLRFEVRIRAASGRLVWHGYVHEANVTVGGTTVGASLESMYNAVRILYVGTGADGAPQDAETATATNAESVNRYGTKEMLYSAGDADVASAEKLRDRFLGAHKWPAAAAESGDDEDAAMLDCLGWWSTLGWEYYADSTGREVFEAGGAAQTVGWQLASNAIGFTKADDVLHHRGTSLRALRKGDKIKVSGSVSNNGTYTVADPPDGSKQTEYTATTIRTQADEEIFDSESGFGFLNKNDFLYLSGTASSDGYWRLNAAEADHLVIQKWWGPLLNTNAYGPSVTVTRLLQVRLESALNNESPGASVTITVAGQKAAQKWTPTTGTWTAGFVHVKVGKEGTPSDNLKLELCANSSGYPGTVLADATVAGSAVGAQASWKEFTLSVPVSVAAGTNYHIVLSRTGATSADHYYTVTVDEDLGYAAGSLNLWDGDAWVTRPTDADMAFQVWGVRENSTQIESMLDSCGLVSRSDVLVTTSITTKHYRDGRTTVREEIERLLDQGTAAGGGLVATVLTGRIFRIEAEPASSAASDFLINGGRLMYADGTPCDSGYVPAGQWARVRGLPSSESFAAASPLFLQRVEYDAKGDKWRWEPRGLPDIFASWSLKQG